MDAAGRTVLAALGLCAAALADDAGLDLRSRCLLYPETDLTWELLDRKGGGEFTLSADDAIALFHQAVDAAKSGRAAMAGRTAGTHAFGATGEIGGQEPATRRQAGR